MFKPKTSDTTVEIQTTNSLKDIVQPSENLSSKHSDPKRVLSDETYTIIKKEKNVRNASVIFWSFILLFIVIGLVLNGIINTWKQGPEYGIGYWILLSFLFLISFYFFGKNLIKVLGWKKVEKRYRESFQLGDIAASTTFADLYKSLIKKNVSQNWIFTFIITYGGIFLAIIFGLAMLEEIVIETPEGSLFDLKLHYKVLESMNRAFGSTTILLVSGAIILLLITILFIFIKLYDKKRIQDAILFIQVDNAKIAGDAEKSARNLNKIWRNTFIVTFILTILLPFALIVFLIWKGIIKVKK